MRSLVFNVFTLFRRYQCLKKLAFGWRRLYLIDRLYFRFVSCSKMIVSCIIIMYKNSISLHSEIIFQNIHFVIGTIKNDQFYNDFSK